MMNASRDHGEVSPTRARLRDEDCPDAERVIDKGPDYEGENSSSDVLVRRDLEQYSEDRPLGERAGPADQNVGG
jgi:hypothetical protein